MFWRGVKNRHAGILNVRVVHLVHLHGHFYGIQAVNLLMARTLYKKSRSKACFKKSTRYTANIRKIHSL